MGSNWDPNFSLTSQESEPDHPSSLNEETNKKQLEIHQNIDITLLNPPYEQNFEEKDDYSLSYIFNAGLRYCSAHKQRNRPEVHTGQPLIRDGLSEKGIKANRSDNMDTNNNKVIVKNQGQMSSNDRRACGTNSGHLDTLFSQNFSNTADDDHKFEGNMNSLRDLIGNSKDNPYNIEGDTSIVECNQPKNNSSTNYFEALNGTNAKVEGPSTQKALQTHASGSSNSNKMKGKLNIASKPPKPPTCHGISRFAPANTGKRKILTMAERAHPVKDARKGNVNDFSYYSKLMGSGRARVPHLKTFQINQTEHGVTNDMNTNSSIKSLSTVSDHVPENQASVTASLMSMQTRKMRDMSTEHGETDMNSDIDNWFNDVYYSN